MDNMNVGKRFMLQAIRAESQSNYKEAIQFYKKAFQSCPELEFYKQDSINVDGVDYDMCGNAISEELFDFVDEKDEKEETPYLTTEERDYLSQYEHTLDYELNEDQKKFLFDNGYVVLENFYTKEQCEIMANEIKQRCLDAGYNFDDDKTWSDSSGFLDIWHCPSFYNLRQDSRLYAIFSQLLRRHDLICSIDRVSVKPPYYLEYESFGKMQKKIFGRLHVEFPVHNDMNLWTLDKKMYQGGLCLLDCPVGNGGFRCIPGFHKLDRIREYRNACKEGKYGVLSKRPPPKTSLFNWFLDKDMIKNECKEIPMKMGDFIIWSSRLPHSNAVNTSNRWRMHCFTQYLTSDFNPLYNETVKESVESGIKPKLYPSGIEVGNRHNEDVEVKYHNQVNVTPFGRKIFGMEKW
jgi:ectoine hydroxylase-related dioxygenase (phytanoyl-CoA dioxygenase family)